MSVSKMQRYIDAMPMGYSNYIKVCLDPFHDKNIKFEGAPTSRSATSVVLCVNQELTVAADDFPTITESTWDAHVVMYPMLNVQACHWANEVLGMTRVDPTTTDTFNLYPLTVQGVNSGQPTYSTNDYATFTPDTIGLDCSNLLTYATGNVNNGPGRRVLRIVGSSFEVVNESPDIYTQGAVTVYRYPLNVEPCNRMIETYFPTGTTVNPTGSNIPTAADVYMVEQRQITELRAPPSNQPNAVLVPGSATWKAKEGVYVTATQYEPEIPFVPVANSNLLVTGYTPTVGPKFTGTNSRYSFGGLNTQRPIQGCYRSGAGTQLAPAWGTPLNAFFPFNLSGAYFTGLSSQYTVLRLRYKTFVEILTDPSDNTLAPLASPTLPYNQDLQELVMKVLADLPPGVPQTWNPDGEAWRAALATLGKVATVAAGPLDSWLPGSGEVARGVGIALTGGSKLIPKGKKNRPKGKPDAKAKPAPKSG